MTKGWFMLSRIRIKWIMGYFSVLLFIAIGLTVFSLLFEIVGIQFDLSISLVSIIGGIGTALLGSSIFYLRKIYKASINNEMESPTNEADRIREVGITAYYLLRPVFAVGFSLLIHIALKSSVNFIVVKETRLDEGFIYLTMFLSFFAGFAAGDLISYLEAKSADLATKTFKH